MELVILEHGTPLYEQMVALRMEILRRPLGLSFTAEQLDREKNDILVGAVEHQQLIGCCVLTPHDPATIQLRQMAVRQDIQQKSIGRSIITFAEETARAKGYKTMMMHARNTALGFYEKCGYRVKGDEFTEVSIPHHYMEKQLLQ